MLTVESIRIKEKSVEKSAKLDEIVSLMEKHNFGDGYDLLPKTPFVEVDFELHNTYAGFANGIRRTLIDGIDVLSIECDEKHLKTDDEFISGTSDVLMKNIALIPVKQDINLVDYEKNIIYLLKTNKTNDIIDIKASDITIGDRSEVKSKFMEKLKKDLGDPALKKSKPKKKGGKPHSRNIELYPEQDIYAKKGGADSKLDDSPRHTTKTSSNAEVLRQSARQTMSSDDSENANLGSYRVTEAMLDIAYNHTRESIIPIEELIPDPNIIIVRLRPGKTIYIEELNFVIGKGYNDFSKFSLLDNVRYEPLDIEPFDMFTNTGTRSIEKDATKFHIGYTTSGNIQPKHVIGLVVESLMESLSTVKQQIATYQSAETKKYYSNDNLEVKVEDDIYHYHIRMQYFTTINMITQRCYILDNNVPLCTGGVERYDTRIGIIKLKHAEPNKLLIKAIEACMSDLKVLDKAFNR